MIRLPRSGEKRFIEELGVPDSDSLAQANADAFPDSRVAVIIVAFNSGAWLEQAIARVLESTVPVSVIVSDNGSTDGSVARLRARWGDDHRLCILLHGQNLGFATAVNRALEQSTEPTVLLLNPDCLVQADTIERVMEAVRRDGRAGMAGPLVCNSDGTEQAGCRRLEPTLGRVLEWSFEKPLRWLGGDAQGFNQSQQPLPAKPEAVEAISGAFMLVDRAAIRTVGAMDARYFLHCEDLDWCRRFRDAGYRVLFVPDALAVHAKGTSSLGRPLRTEWHKHRGMIRYYRKFSKGGLRHVKVLLMSGLILVRFAIIALALWARRLWGGARS